jgi:hypothetical protein
MSMNIEIGPLKFTAEAREGYKVYAVTAKAGFVSCGAPPLHPDEWQALVARSRAIQVAEQIAKQWRGQNRVEPALLDLLAEHIRHG